MMLFALAGWFTTRTDFVAVVGIRMRHPSWVHINEKIVHAAYLSKLEQLQSVYLKKQ